MAQELEYQVATASNQGAFEKLVNTALAEGWQLHGSTTVSSYKDTGVIFAQGLVRGKQAPSVYEERGIQSFG
jgi:hypothetical protein